MYREEINDKLIDPKQIKKNLSRIFKANEWEEEYNLDDIVDKLVTARRALWHIRARIVSGQTKDRKNWRLWEDVPDDEKEELK